MASLIDQFVSASPEAPFPRASLPALAEEVRARILETVGKNGGHLASSLGVVELTIALLTIFDPRKDRIVWDVGHQGYAWKLLTDRADRFSTLRQHGGLSGFLKRAESDCDAFDAGHAGTAISAALGIAAARDHRKGKEHVIAVVGDASLSNGLSLEALNNVTATADRLIIILNDNEMSISENVGALSRHFGKTLASRRYNRVKTRLERWAMRNHMAPFRNGYHRMKRALKTLFAHYAPIEDLGIRYVGPIDGHDFDELENALTSARDFSRPIFLHVATKKGRGYKPAETNPGAWHGVGPFDVATGVLPPSKPGYSAAFGQALCEMAGADDRIVAITAAMKSGTGLSGFAEAFPDRFFDVGISEEHAITFAGGLAASGMRPFVAIYSTFAQRAVDEFFHDVCLQNLPVTLCLDRAGVVGADGATHHGLYDIPMLRSLPNLVYMQPRDEEALGRMLSLASTIEGPCVIRYPRGGSSGQRLANPPAPIGVGKAEVVRPLPAGTKGVWIWALGDMLPIAIEVADKLQGEGVAAGVVDPRFIKPLDSGLLLEQAKDCRLFVTIENGALAGGFGSVVLETLSSAGLEGQVERFGWPDAVVGQGTSAELRADFGLEPDILVAAIHRRLLRP